MFNQEHINLSPNDRSLAKNRKVKSRIYKGFEKKKKFSQEVKRFCQEVEI
jgi:hypothetical protein